MEAAVAGHAGSERKRIGAKRDSLHIRLYLWLYDASPSRINTCKLLWAYLLMPIVLPLRVILAPFFAAVGWVADRVPKREKKFDLAEYERERDRRVAKAKAKAAKAQAREENPGRLERGLDSFSAGASAWYARWQNAFKWAAVTVGLAFTAGVVALLVYEIVTNFVVFLTVVGFSILGAVAVGGLIYVIYLLDSKGVLKRAAQGIKEFWHLLKDLGRSFHNHTCADVELT